VLFQALPLAQENEERVPIDQVEQQGMKRSNKAKKQQWGERYLKMVSTKVQCPSNNNMATSISNKAQKRKQQGMSTRE